MAIVTISRGTFSGGAELADCLGRALGYRVVSREVLAEAAERFGVAESALAGAMEEGPRFWDRFLKERTRYLAFVQAALCEHVEGDGVVYHGHAGHLLLRGVRHVLRVRLIAPLDYRVAQVGRRLGLGAEEAARHVQNVDRDRVKWTRFLYGLDWNDPANYDVVLNLEQLDIEAACGAVAALARGGRFTADGESLRSFADVRLASRVRAALAGDPATAAAEVEVRAAGGVVEVVARIADPVLVERVIAGARAVEGVAEVRYGTRVMLDGPAT